MLGDPGIVMQDGWPKFQGFCDYLDQFDQSNGLWIHLNALNQELGLNSELDCHDGLKMPFFSKKKIWDLRWISN